MRVPATMPGGRRTRWTPPLWLSVLPLALPSHAVEPVTLWPLYQQKILPPCEYVGYSFEQGPASLGEMRAAGSEIAGVNQMWFPFPDPEAPYGAGVSVGPLHVQKASQRFALDEPFAGIIVVFPTMYLTGSATVTLSRPTGGRIVARQRFEEVPDGFGARLEFETQPPGEYLIEVGEPAGTIGVWVTPVEKAEGGERKADTTAVESGGWFSNRLTETAPSRSRRRLTAAPDRTATVRERLKVSTYPPGQMNHSESGERKADTEGTPEQASFVVHRSSFSVDGVVLPGVHLEFAHLRPGGEVVWHADPGSHRFIQLDAPRMVDTIAAAGLKSMIWVGNWNNGAFPYYPDWFYQRFPDITMVDLDGSPILAGMFGIEKGWPSIDHPVIVDGTARYISEVVRANRDSPYLLYWSLGGEALYPNYLWEWNGWPDYGANARAHFVAWLQRRHGGLQALNRAWGARLRGWDEVSAPRERSVSRAFADWIDYRFAAMAERMSWHYAAVRAEDPERLIVTTNHGNIFWSHAYAALGADLPQYADASDGFEMGQIMEGDDPGYYNLWWASAIAGLGKVGAPARLAYKFPDPGARGGGTSYTPAAARRYCMEAFGSGWWHLGLVQWSGDLPDGEWGVQGTPAEKEIERVFADLKTLRPLAEGSWALLPRVALYLSRDQWILKGWDPRWTTLHAWLIQHQWDHAILWEHQLLHGEAEPYPVVISAYNELIAPEAQAALERYVERGGKLVVMGKAASGKRQAEGTASDDAVGSSFPAHRSAFHLPPDIWAALQELPRALDSAGVRPFCRLQACGLVSWSLELEPLHGHHNHPPQLAPRRTLGQTFAAPGPWIGEVALRTPTYTRQPAGFEAVLRLRRGGPQGEILKEARVPAEQIRDNAWTPMTVRAGVTPGETLFLEMTPDRDIPDLALGIWASTHGGYDHGQAYLDGEPQPWDLEFKVGYTVEMPSSQVVEAFTLCDGASFLIPLINLAQEEAMVRVELDPDLLAGNGRPTATSPTASLRDAAVAPSFIVHRSSLSYDVFDALSGERLAEGIAARVVVPAQGYRVLSIRPRTSRRQTRARLAIAGRRLEALRRRGYQLDFHDACRERAQAALARGDPGKALGHLNRLASQPAVRIRRCEIARGGDLVVEVIASHPDGRPLADAAGVLRVVPLPGVASRLREIVPGRYRARLSARALAAYDYAARTYRPYRGPLQAIGNLWRGRTLAQFQRPLRKQATPEHDGGPQAVDGGR